MIKYSGIVHTYKKSEEINKCLNYKMSNTASMKVKVK